MFNWVDSAGDVHWSIGLSIKSAHYFISTDFQLRLNTAYTLRNDSLGLVPGAFTNLLAVLIQPVWQWLCTAAPCVGQCLG